MAGINLLRMLGALLRWLFNGMRKKYKFVLQDDSGPFFTWNFIVGVFTFLGILFILF